MNGLQKEEKEIEEEIEYDSEEDYNPEEEDEEEKEEEIKLMKYERERERDLLDIRRTTIMEKFNRNVQVKKWEIDGIKDKIDKEEYQLMMKKYVDQMIQNERKADLGVDPIDVDKWAIPQEKKKAIKNSLKGKIEKVISQTKLPYYNSVIDWLNVACEVKKDKDLEILSKMCEADLKAH